jgi:hypothetical protein
MFLNLKILYFKKKYLNLLLFFFYKYIYFMYVCDTYFVFYKYLNLYIYKNINYYKYIIIFFNFFLLINNIYLKIQSFFFCEFFVDGLYYRVKYYKKYNFLGFILGYNHYIIYKLPKKIFAFAYMRRRRFILLSFHLTLLLRVSMELVNLKYPNLFKNKGLKLLFTKYRHKIIIKKK